MFWLAMFALNVFSLVLAVHLRNWVLAVGVSLLAAINLALFAIGA